MELKDKAKVAVHEEVEDALAQAVGLRENASLEDLVEMVNDLEFDLDFRFEELREPETFVALETIRKVYEHTQPGNAVRAWLVMCFADFVTLEPEDIGQVPHEYLFEVMELHRLLYDVVDEVSTLESVDLDDFPLARNHEETGEACVGYIATEEHTTLEPAGQTLRKELLTIAKSAKYCPVRTLRGFLERNESRECLKRVLHSVVERLDVFAGVQMCI